MQKNIAIFGSGSGSNAKNLCDYFRSSRGVRVVVICTNNPHSLIVKRAEKLAVPCFIFSKKELCDFVRVEKALENFNVDFVVLAGFLLKIPEKMIKKYPEKIINIHPSLLPKYAGKGMYGNFVHESVLKNNDTESGITIHLVNKEYDKGEILLQKKCSVTKSETVSSLRVKIQRLEHYWLPLVVEKHILQ